MLDGHDYLHDLYDHLNDTPMQRKLRKLAPMPIGCVFIQWPEMDYADIRTHFRTMRELGFTCLKGIMLCPGTARQEVQKIALEEGLSPWWYDEAGWRDITPELLEELGLPAGMDIDEARQHPKMLEYQRGVMEQRISVEPRKRRNVQQGSAFLPGKRDFDAVPGTNKLTAGTALVDEDVPLFVEWLKKNYKDLDELMHAWNCRSSSHGRHGWQTWDEVAAAVPGFPPREFRHLRDILRFKSDMKLERLRAQVALSHEKDPDAPVRAGGEISIFLPHTAAGIDMEGYAETMAEGGCFYPSMHPGWHLEEVAFELVRPTFMQAAMCVDWAKGVWSAPIESSGGPQWWSGGGKVPFVPEVQMRQPAFTFTEGTMAQLICSYLAAGFKGFGLWCWNARESGWEAGEYALCDRNNRVTDRARRVGRLGQSMRRYRRELWQAHKEPLVGLFQDWENDAMWAALATSGRDSYKTHPVNARIGAARALMNANVPWEHVTMRQLAKGLAPRYPVIYLPAVMCLTSEMIGMLTEYVNGGGRVVMDMPGAWLDERGHLVATAEGSPFEKLFGVVLNEYSYCNNEPFELDGLSLSGFTAVMTPTSAGVLKHYHNGLAAVTENRLGKGAAVILGAEAALQCLRPGNAGMERLLVDVALGGHGKPFECDGALVYRLAAPLADHFFLVNDGPECSVALRTGGRYANVRDVETDAAVDLADIQLAGYDARWLRAER